jgi:mannitol/fructose-specific phosphotransferase system IIA component (Ntr-type)
MGTKSYRKEPNMGIELDDVVVADSVELGADVSDWREAVKRAGSLLVRVGAAEERYVEAMIRTVDELGPYAVLAPGIAIPHARPEDGAIDVGIGVLTLSTPVEFGAGDNDPVDLVFPFATPDAKKHTAALQALANFLEEEENVTRLRNATTTDEVVQLIKESS